MIFTRFFNVVSTAQTVIWHAIAFLKSVKILPKMMQRETLEVKCSPLSMKVRLGVCRTYGVRGVSQGLLTG